MYSLHYIRVLLCFVFLVHITLTAKAETGQDSINGDESAILFRFIPGRTGFYSPFKGNDVSITEAAELIEKHRSIIEDGNAFVIVRGFCNSYPSTTENLKAAKIRSNRVKSWFITHHGMKEEHYMTANSSRLYKGMKDVVAVLGLHFKPGYSPHETAMKRKRAEDDSIARLTVQRAEQMMNAEMLRREKYVREKATENLKGIYLGKTGYRIYVKTPWYIKSNLIYDAILMPSLEIEYRFSKNWSAAIEGNIAWWHNSNKHRYYQLATIVPEVRWWFKPSNERKGHYIGLFGGGGWYDLENGWTGYKGTGGMAGISYGYMFPVGKHLALEAGLGLGYIQTRYEKYVPDEGHYPYMEGGKTRFVGPVKLKLALVWNIGHWVKKGGQK